MMSTMIARRSLSQLLRVRQTSAVNNNIGISISSCCAVSNNAFRQRTHFWDQRNSAYYRPFHSTIATKGYQDELLSRINDQTISNKNRSDRNDIRHANNNKTVGTKGHGDFLSLRERTINNNNSNRNSHQDYLSRRGVQATNDSNRNLRHDNKRHEGGRKGDNNNNHSTVAVGTKGYQDYPSRRNQTINNDSHRNINHTHHGGGRQGNNNRFNKNHHGGGGDSKLTPDYISHLETRAREHIKNFPHDYSTAHSSSDATDATTSLLSSWSRTTVELIMLMSKLWGRGISRNQKDQQQQQHIFNAVNFSHDLLTKVLMIRKNEIEGVLEESKFFESKKKGSGDGRTTSLNNNEPDGRGATATIRPQARAHLNTEILCQTVALGWSRCDPKLAVNAARNAQSILEQLEEICSKREQLSNEFMRREKNTFLSRDGTPSILLYNHVLSCWARSSLDPEAEMHAKMLLDRMIDDSGGSTSFCRPDTYSYNNMLNLYASRGDVTSAEALLKQMEESNEVSVDVYSYSITMNAFQKRFTSNSGNPDSRNMKDPERAEELLSRLVTNYEKSEFRNDKLRPTNVTFGTIIAMYAQADRMLKEDNHFYGNRTRSWKAKKIARDIHNNNETKNTNLGWGASNAERVLDWMIGLGDRERQRAGEDGDIDNKVIRPSTHNFVTVMDAWAKAGKGVEGAQRCERLLDRLVSMYDKLGYNELRPIPLCFGTVIDAWAKADEEHETAEHAESLLDRMEELFLNRKSSNPREMLSNVAYNLAIDAWSRRSGNRAAVRAEIILRRLITNYQQTNNRFLRPDVISYTGVMKAYVHHPKGGDKALQILEEMNDQYRNGNVKAGPDRKSLSVAMDACVKCGLTRDAERILNGIEDSEKDRVLFNIIMSGYKSEGRGEEAEAALRRMISLEKAGRHRCSPDMISYALCIEAWENDKSQDRALRARALLDESIIRYQSGDGKCKPSNVTFNVAAASIASSDDPDREAHVLALFEKMEEIGCEPNLISFNILMKACGKATGSEERKRKALQIAASAFNSLSSVGLRADSITYTSMIHAMVNLMEDSPEKTKAVAGIFQQCCDEGCLNQHILDTLAAKTPQDDFLSITGEKTSQISSFPAKWRHRSSRADTSHTE